ncbi:MAG: hypothetical protein II811_01405 [Spirochaetaceae bacterium]|nr:hypothetical protein [Spirochaetaceae bacterium]
MKIAKVLLMASGLLMISVYATSCSNAIETEEETSIESENNSNVDNSKAVIPMDIEGGGSGITKGNRDTGKTGRESSKSNRGNKGSRESRSGRSKSNK